MIHRHPPQPPALRFTALPRPIYLFDLELARPFPIHLLDLLPDHLHRALSGTSSPVSHSVSMYGRCELRQLIALEKASN
jgi:hypothetical protein